MVECICRFQNPDIPRSGRGGAAHGGAGRGGAGQDTGRTVRRGGNSPPCLPEHRRQLPWRFLRKHEQNKMYVNQKRSTTSVDKRFLSRTMAALRSWLLTNGPSPICLCKPFSCKACPGIYAPESMPRTAVFANLEFGVKKKECLRQATQSRVHRISEFLDSQIRHLRRHSFNPTKFPGMPCMKWADRDK